MNEFTELAKTIDIIAGDSYRIEISLSNGTYESATYKKMNFIKAEGLSDAVIFERCRTIESITGTDLNDVIERSVAQIK